MGSVQFTWWLGCLLCVCVCVCVCVCEHGWMVERKLWMWWDDDVDRGEDEDEELWVVRLVGG